MRSPRPLRNIVRPLAAALGCLTVTAAFPAFAQQVAPAPSQITPPSLRPDAQGGSSLALPGASALQAPAGAQNLSVGVGRVLVDGTFPELQAQTDAALAPLQGRRVTLAQIYAAANAIEQAYAAQGYVLVRVVVPPQKLTNGGDVRFVLVDGFVEAVDVKGVPERQRAVVSARMAAIIGQRQVKLTQIERRLLLVSDLPGLVLRSTLARGNTPGGAMLVLEATQNYVTGAAGFDDRLPSSLGTFALNASLSSNSALGFGEQVYASASSGADLGRAFDGRSPVQIFGGGFVLPLGPDGFTLNPEYTNSVTRPAVVAGVPPSVGTFQRLTVRAAYPVIRTRDHTLTLQGGFEYIDEDLVPTGFPTQLYHDAYSVLRLTGTDVYALPWNATLQTSGTFSKGITGRSPSEALASGIPFSRQGTSPDFTKFNGSVTYLQVLPQDLRFTFVARAQSTLGDPVFVAEQFSLEGLDALSAFASGALEVDEGATGRAELARVFATEFNGVLGSAAPYVFAAGGRGALARPTAVEQKVIDAGSAGIGVRVGADAVGLPYGTTVTAELARKFSDARTIKDGYRANVAVAVKF